MSKGLEALKQYRSQQTGVNVYADELLDIVEKELKEKEQYEEILNDYGLTLANFREACLLLAQWKSAHLSWAEYDKELQALDIIRKKPFNNVWFFYYKDYEDYYENAEYADEKKKLTEKEYNLLKEEVF